MKKPATTRSKKRPRKRQQIIVLMDGAGNYYEFPRATIERRRVSDRRKEEVVAALQNVPREVRYIQVSAIPGSTAAARFVGQLHYVGFYLSSTESKR